ncbi:MAG TPA: hypothetical protein VKV57_03270 [bacterium]|nr:hypothetical protein [bacterium]
MQVTRDESRLIRAAIHFANLQRITSPEQVEAMFFQLGPQQTGPTFKALSLSPISAEAAIAAFRDNDQAELRRWLTEIAERGVAARDRIRDEVNVRLRAVNVHPIFDGRRLRLEVWPSSGVQAAYAYAVAMILDDERGLTNRLGHCPGRSPMHPCGRFVLTLEGRPRRFCSVAHRLAWNRADAKERVWRSRHPGEGPRPVGPRGSA